MYKKFISSKTEDLCLYIQCYCGSEIIKFYYYKGTPTCPEVMIIDYFGNVSSKLFKYKYMDLSKHSFYNLVNALKQCESYTSYDCDVIEFEKCLSVNKKNNEFTILTLYKIQGKKRLKIWDITIHDVELKEINNALEEMKNNYEVINNVTRSNQ